MLSSDRNSLQASSLEAFGRCGGGGAPVAVYEVPSLRALLSSRVQKLGWLLEGAFDECWAAARGVKPGEAAEAEAPAEEEAPAAAPAKAAAAAPATTRKRPLGGEEDGQAAGGGAKRQRGST